MLLLALVTPRHLIAQTVCAHAASWALLLLSHPFVLPLPPGPEWDLSPLILDTRYPLVNRVDGTFAISPARSHRGRQPGARRFGTLRAELAEYALPAHTPTTKPNTNPAPVGPSASGQHMGMARVSAMSGSRATRSGRHMSGARP